jgi:DNA-binding transcriptional LysR family regulator
MRKKIPSSTALTAFEAAARHGSFARAAEELSLTEGAISRQIGRLEAFLGVALFERVGNRVDSFPTESVTRSRFANRLTAWIGTVST